MALTRPTAKQISYTAPGSGAVARTQHDKNAERVSVKDFGAVGDGVADDTAAIQAAITAARTLPAVRANGITDITSPYFAQTSTLFFPPGKYRVTAPLWFGVDSGATGWDASKIVESVFGYGAVIVGQTGGKAVIDCSGAFGMKWHGLTIYGGATATPKVGLLLARSGNAVGDNPSAGAHRFTDVNIHGDFTLACVYNYASEINVFNNCYFYQNSGKTVYLGTNNNARHAVTSDYCTLATTVQSAYGDFFSTCIVKSNTGNATPNGAVFYIESMDFGPSVYNSYIDTSSAVYMPNFFFRNAQGLTSANTTAINQGVRIVGNTFEYHAIQDIIAIDTDHQIFDLTVQANAMPIDTSTGNRAHVAVSSTAVVKNLDLQATSGDTLGTPSIVLGAGEVASRNLAVRGMRTLVVGTGWSYVEGDLTRDGAYHQIDLTSLGVPATAKFIAVKVAAKTAAAADANSMILRGYGSTYTQQHFEVTPPVSSIAVQVEGLVPVVNGKIEYSVPANFNMARILFREYHL